MTGHKLFLALQPDPAAAERIARVVTAEHEARGLQARLRPSRVFHITLHYFGYFPGEPAVEVVAQAGRAAADVVMPAFDVGFDTLLSWGAEGAPRHPFVLTGGAALDGARALQRVLTDRLAAHGVEQPARAFVPHLTLRYDKRPAPAWPVTVPGWRAGDFVLVKSVQGMTRHDVIERWPLPR
ncbi:MAG: RNA 2',3'-cyclic phosphodiesterase [Variovorax sp.]|nr:MAG: RNA 2',3'-cyclic phosphodiesterase [Variovorax sp.]